MENFGIMLSAREGDYLQIEREEIVKMRNTSSSIDTELHTCKSLFGD